MREQPCEIACQRASLISQPGRMQPFDLVMVVCHAHSLDQQQLRMVLRMVVHIYTVLIMS